MPRTLPFDIPRIQKSEVLLRNRILDETAVGIGGIALPEVAALFGVDEVSVHPDGLCLSPCASDESFVPIALSLNAKVDSPRLVLGLAPPLAARLVDAVLARPAVGMPGEKAAVHTWSQGEIGALLYGLDRAGKDWIAYCGKKCTLRGVLEDTDQISDYLGRPAETVIRAQVRTGDMRYPIRLWYHRSDRGPAKRIHPFPIEDASAWCVRVGISSGWSTVLLSEMSSLASGDRIVLDSWNIPGIRGGIPAPLFWNGNWCRYGRFLSETAVEIVNETEGTKEMNTKQSNSPAPNSPIKALMTDPDAGDGKDLTVTVRVEVGSLKMSVEQALGLIPGRVVQLDRPVGPEVSVYVGDKRLGGGTLVDVDGFMAVEIKEIG